MPVEHFTKSKVFSRVPDMLKDNMTCKDSSHGARSISLHMALQEQFTFK